MGKQRTWWLTLGAWAASAACAVAIIGLEGWRLTLGSWLLAGWVAFIGTWAGGSWLASRRR
jgi:hypothetical protein